MIVGASDSRGVVSRDGAFWALYNCLCPKCTPNAMGMYVICKMMLYVEA